MKLEGLIARDGMAVRAACSCGKFTTLRWSEGQQKYMPDDPRWKFRTRAESEALNLGWYCGEEGHEQQVP